MPNLSPSDVHVNVPVGTERHSFSQNQDDDFRRNKKRRKRKNALSGQKISPWFNGKMGVPAVHQIQKKFHSAANRRSLAAKGHALSDGSYPIGDAEDLHSAAILARSGHGDVAGAKRLIARRSKELGVSNPLDDEEKAEKSESGIAPLYMVFSGLTG